MKVTLWKHCRLSPINLIYYQNSWEYNCYRVLWFGFEWLRKGEWNDLTRQAQMENK
jgi:hypothetical protein